MKSIYLIFILLLPFKIFAQVYDDFEDGDLAGWTENITGHWAASNENPITGVYSLKHNLSSVEGISYITHDIAGISIENGETIWQFNFKNGSWNPSGFNYFCVYLFSDQIDLSANLNGYAVGINMFGTNDVLTLWKKTEDIFTPIVETPYIWPTGATIGVQVTRSALGEWQVEYDTDGGFDNLVLGGTATDNSHTDAFYTGAFFEYTTTRAGEFWVDDISVTGPPDTDPPQIIMLEAISNNTLIINFNENLSQSSAENILNYSVDGGIGNPNTATLSVTDNKQIELVFTNTFIDNQQYTLTVNNVEDLSGNPCINETGIFSYTQIAVTEVTVISSNELDILFNKSVDSVTAETNGNYWINKDIGNPVTAALNETDLKLVHLTFVNNFVSEELYTITVSNVEDNYDNVITTTYIDFSYYEIQTFDIVINEIMCDINPAPNVLPVHEYLEIFNTSVYDLSLSGWTLQVGDNTERDFPNIVISPGGYAIICEDVAEIEFQAYGATIPILSPTQLTVSGKRLIIRNESGKIIEDLTYSDEWYDDEDRDDGGWSLERIDPLNFCGENDNWTVSVSDFGGTPGYINSVDDDNIDNTAPDLSTVRVIASDYLIMDFNENISYESGSELTNFTVNNGINNPSEAYTNPENRTEVHLRFATQFSDKQTYTLSIEGIEDNCDNQMPMTGIEFTYYLIYPVDLWVIDDKQIKLKFSETVDLSTGTNINNYSCNNNVGNPAMAVRESSDTTIIYLLFDNPFPDGEKSILNISGIEDLNGNKMVSVNIPFVYYLPKTGDLVVNEILFDPYPDGSDFVELYNRTPYDIDLVNIQLATRDDENPDSITSISSLSETNFLFPPESYMAFTTNKEGVLRFYMSQDEENLIEIENIPAYTNDDGIVLVLYKNDTIIDEFSYNADMHFKLLDNEEGVSLERVNYDNRTQDPSNWHSASELVGFATPAYKNSQFTEAGDPSNEPVNVEPHVFSPDNDGYDDYANIHYQFQNPGHVATVYIFDAKGRMVQQLANNLLLATEGTLVWDGLYADKRVAPAGTYLVYFSVFELNGTVKLYKKTVVLAKRI